ncbi:hypothetical protein BDY19DRAFT_601042 [Irpex rosettiformis]|uniref:Uncharacterized protein n=1 Tax=Irpex rosettiformis TaxID=378272 RepID=A0ACB8TPL0_9APHY|nr:hypothetical protein BDY19DRAFT_601042 [Irpex rosettiformis]
MGCLLLHCAANLLVWINEAYVIIRRGRNPKDVTYVVISTALVIITAIAFGVFAFFLAEIGSQTGSVDFATLGAPVAYAVLILSWLVTMLAIQSLVFAGVDKYHAYFGSSRTNRIQEAEATLTPKTPIRRNKAPVFDLSKRPLPLTIINVVQNGEHELYRNPHTAPFAPGHLSKALLTPKTMPVTLSESQVATVRLERLEELEHALQIESPPRYKTTYNHWSNQV